MSERIKTRFLILSDTHSRAPVPSTETNIPCRWPLPEADVAIHTGDLTMTGKIDEHEQAIDMIHRLQADLKIVIPGNHDLTLDTAYYREKGHLHGPRPKYDEAQLSYIRDLYTGPAAQAANIVYMEEGTRTFSLKNGARLTVYASAYTPEFCDWAFAYPRDYDRYNPTDAANPVAGYNFDDTNTNTNIDVMLTHGPPEGILDQVMIRRHITSVGCANLLRAVTRAKPLLHCFGHIHEGWGATRMSWTDGRQIQIQVDEQTTDESMCAYIEASDMKRGEETLFANASIMDLRYRPRQAPWVVDLLLEKEKSTGDCALLSSQSCGSTLNISK